MQPATTYPIPTARDHIDAYERIRRAACAQLVQAQTPQERADAQMWIDNADRNIERWLLRLEWSGA